MKPLADLKLRECRWPVETHGKDHLFCGEPTADGVPYCEHHRRLAYKPGSSLKLSAGALDRLSDALDGRRYRRRLPAREGETHDTAQVLAQRAQPRAGVMSLNSTVDSAAGARRLPARKPLGFRPNPRRFNGVEVAR